MRKVCSCRLAQNFSREQSGLITDPLSTIKKMNRDMQSRFVIWIYNTSINYLHRQGLSIRCTNVKLNKQTDEYELSFTYQAKEIVESFSRVELEHCHRPEPVVKYLCNRANHKLVFGGID